MRMYGDLHERNYPFLHPALGGWPMVIRNPVHLTVAETASYCIWIGNWLGTGDNLETVPKINNPGTVCYCAEIFCALKGSS
jgi:hypothetical protein